jgi:hypothetical protein
VDRHVRDEQPLLHPRHVEHLGQRANPGALGRDRLEAGRGGGSLDHQFTADRQPEPADASAADVRAALQIGDRGLKVARTAPAAGIRVALALALAARVEQQYAVAVTDQHPRMRLRPFAARKGGR